MSAGVTSSQRQTVVSGGMEAAPARGAGPSCRPWRRRRRGPGRWPRASGAETLAKVAAGTRPHRVRRQGREPAGCFRHQRAAQAHAVAAGIEAVQAGAALRIEFSHEAAPLPVEGLRHPEEPWHLGAGHEAVADAEASASITRSGPAIKAPSASHGARRTRERASSPSAARTPWRKSTGTRAPPI